MFGKLPGLLFLADPRQVEVFLMSSSASGGTPRHEVTPRHAPCSPMHYRSPVLFCFLARGRSRRSGWRRGSRRRSWLRTGGTPTVVAGGDRSSKGKPKQGRRRREVTMSGLFDGGSGSGKVNPATGSADPVIESSRVAGDGEKEARLKVEDDEQ
ncbi:hypothetical protein Droror1_Dr00014716 [Drosera rotundifolia]